MFKALQYVQGNMFEAIVDDAGQELIFEHLEDLMAHVQENLPQGTDVLAVPASGE